VVVGSYVPDGALDGCDSRCVGERRRLVPVLVALYVDAVQRIYCCSLVALTTHDHCLDCAVQDLVGMKLHTPGSDAPQIESPKARQGLVDQQWYQCMSATSFAGTSQVLVAQQLQVATASSQMT
jgi:predicted nucleotidyltransferase